MHAQLSLNQAFEPVILLIVRNGAELSAWIEGKCCFDKRLHRAGSRSFSWLSLALCETVISSPLSASGQLQRESGCLQSAIWYKRTTDLSLSVLFRPAGDNSQLPSPHSRSLVLTTSLLRSVTTPIS